jgi:hypothetical protein
MEPRANEYYSEPQEPHDVALVSIAISLKRIADALEVSQISSSISSAEIALKDFDERLR